MTTTRKPVSPFSKPEAHDSSGFLQWQVTSLWQRAMIIALKPHHLTHVQFVLLASLLWLSRSKPLITQVMLARHAKLDVMMTSQVLRTLEARGLIKRQPHPHDVRAKALTLTKAGQQLAITTVPVVEQVDEQFFDLPASEHAAFNRSLQRLIAKASITSVT